MKILSIRKGYLADHSSTSYEFLAVDKPLTSKQRAAVANLSSRAQPSSRRIHFIYHAEGYDIPGGWEPLMKKYYDVMYTESYDWWTLAVAFDKPNAEFVKEIKQYDFRGEEDLGVDVIVKGKRIIVAIHCRVDAGEIMGGSYYDDYYDYYDDEDEEEDEGPIKECGDGLLELLIDVRKCLMKGQFRPLYTIYWV